MKHQIVVNNYVLGAMVKTTPRSKIVKQERLDRYHTLLVYEGLTKFEIQHTEKVLARKLKVVEE